MDIAAHALVIRLGFPSAYPIKEKEAASTAQWIRNRENRDAAETLKDAQDKLEKLKREEEEVEKQEEERLEAERLA